MNSFLKKKIRDFYIAKRIKIQNKENTMGEFLAIVDKQPLKNQDFEDIDLFREELKNLSRKFSLTDTVEIVHKFTKINKNKLYKWLLASKEN